MYDDEVIRIKEGFAKAIEDGKRIEAFTSLDEWKWYVENVLKPTVAAETERVMHGEYLENSQKDVFMRGFVQGIESVYKGIDSLAARKAEAQKKSKELDEKLKEQS